MKGVAACTCCNIRFVEFDKIFKIETATTRLRHNSDRCAKSPLSKSWTLSSHFRIFEPSRKRICVDINLGGIFVLNAKVSILPLDESYYL